MRRTRAIRESLAAVGLLLGLLYLVAHCSGCAQTSADKARALAVATEHAAITVAYGLSLDQCKAVGKASGSFAVFEACERAETRKLCTERPPLRSAWVRCADVGVLP